MSVNLYREAMCMHPATATIGRLMCVIDVYHTVINHIVYIHDQKMYHRCSKTSNGGMALLSLHIDSIECAHRICAWMWKCNICIAMLHFFLFLLSYNPSPTFFWNIVHVHVLFTFRLGPYYSSFSGTTAVVVSSTKRLFTINLCLRAT